MTDSDIIKALECCAIDDCKECPVQFGAACKIQAAAETITHIKYQQKEIERLKTEKDNLIRNHKECAMEAVKDFAERLKARAYVAENEWSHGEHPLVVEVDDIDEIVAEMEG